MRSIYVEDLMVPLGEYATVTLEANLYDAVVSLEKAQKHVDPTRHKHRALLVLDQNSKVVGKVSMFDILIALGAKHEELEKTGMLPRSGLSRDFVKSMLEKSIFWNEPMEHICGRAPNLYVKDFMEVPAEGLFIEADATLAEAIHQLVSFRYLSLLVTRGDDVVGILRLSDVFSKICEKIKDCRT